MKTQVFITIVITSSLFYGCGAMPQNAAEFRKQIPGATFGKYETFTVNRDLGQITRTYKKMAPKCLNIKVKTTESGYMYHHVVVDNYTPTVLAKKNRTELHLQKIHEKGVITPGKIPDKGFFVLVTDATRLGKNKTRIDMYYPSIGHDALVNAIKGWSTGKSIKCPDMTKQ